MLAAPSRAARLVRIGPSHRSIRTSRGVQPSACRSCLIGCRAAARSGVTDGGHSNAGLAAAGPELRRGGARWCAVIMVSTPRVGCALSIRRLAQFRVERGEVGHEVRATQNRRWHGELA